MQALTIYNCLRTLKNPMQEHKYKIGQKVWYCNNKIRPAIVYGIVKDGSGFIYLLDSSEPKYAIVLPCLRGIQDFIISFVMGQSENCMFTLSEKEIFPNKKAVIDSL